VPNTDYDVVVAGAGPAGSACAAALARMGIRTLLLDRKRFPRDKTCGDALGTRVPAVLRQLGLPDDFLDTRFHRVTGVVLTSPGGHRFRGNLPVNGDRQARGHLAPRRELDHLLLRHAAACGAQVREGAAVTGLLRGRNGVEGVVCAGADGSRKEPVRARAVVGADGEHSVVRREMGTLCVDRARQAFAARAYFEDVEGLEDAIELHYDRRFLPAYAWVFPEGAGRANVGCGVFQYWRHEERVDVRRTLAAVLEDHPHIRSRFRKARRVGPVQAWPLSLGSQSRHTYAPGVLLAGDAACFTDTLSGEGIYYALHSGLFAAETLAEALGAGGCTRENLAAYERRWREAFTEDFRYGARVQTLFRRWPRVLDRIARKAAADPVLASRIAGAIVGTYTPRILFTPGVLARVLF